MNSQTSKAFWERVAKLYAPFMRRSEPLYAEISRQLRPLISRKMAVLELACGSGQLTFQLASGAGSWEATDFSEKMVKEAMKKSCPPNLRFAVQDATCLPYESARFDAVLIANALHIMPEPDRALSEIHRVLKPGGLLLAPTFLWGTTARQRLGAWLMERAGFHVFHRWDADTLAAYVQARGFAVQEKATVDGGVQPLCCLMARRST